MDEESNLYSDALVYNNGTLGYGLFQIPDSRWCTYGSPGKGCNKDCRDFLNSNLSDDIECVKKVIESEGYANYRSWTGCVKTPYEFDRLCACYDENREKGFKFAKWA